MNETMKLKLKNMLKLVFLFMTFQICLFIFFNLSTVAFAKEIDVVKSIEITNENGQNKETYIPGDRIRVDVQWEIKEQAQKGDTFTFTLPKELRKFDGIIDLKDKQGISYGRGISNANSIIFTFSYEVERRENIGGYFYIESQIEHMKYEEHKMVKIQFVVNGHIYDTSASIDVGSQTSYSKSNSSPRRINEVFYKFGNVSRENEDTLEWALRVNYKGDNLGKCRIYDNLRDGHELIPGSIEIYKGYTNFNDGSIVNLTRVPRQEYSEDYLEFKRGFDLYLKNIEGEVYTIYYKTKVLRKSEDYSNQAVLQACSKEPIYRDCIVKTFTAGGEAWGDLKKFKGKLKVIKKDEKTNLRLSGAEFQLLDDKQNKIIANLKTDENGEAITDDIPSGIYYLKEIKAPDGYESEANINSIDLNFKQDNIIERVITNKKIESKEPQEPEVKPEKPEVKEPEVKEEPKVEPEKPEVKEPELKEEPKVEPEKSEVKDPEVKEEPVVKPEKPEVKDPEVKEEPKVEPEKPEVKEPEVKEEPKVEPEKPEVKEPEVKEEPEVKPEKPEVKDPELKEEPKVEPEKPEVKDPEVKEEPEVEPEKPEVKEPEVKEEPVVKPEKPEIKDPEVKEEPVVKPEKPEVKDPEIKEEPKVEPEKPEVKEPEVKEEPKAEPEKPEVKDPEVKEEPKVEPEKPEVKEPEIKNKKNHRKKKDYEPEVKPEIIEVEEPQIKEDPEINPEKPEMKDPEVKEEQEVEPEIIIEPDDEVPLGNPEDDKEPEEPEKSQEPEIIENPQDEVPLGNIEPNKNPEKPKDNIKHINRKENKELKPVKKNTFNTMKILPKTGEGNKALFYIGGLIIIILGIFIKKRI